MQVAKAGDTVADIGEGRNAGCGLNIGVLSGADSAEQLKGADIVVPDITHVPLEFYSIGGENIKAVLDFQQTAQIISSIPAVSAATHNTATATTSAPVSRDPQLETSVAHGPAGGQQIKINIASSA